MTDYVAYFRVSTDKQGITGLGMDAQRESVTRFVSGRGRLVAEFIEVESGRNNNRLQLRAALEECRKRPAVLLIARLDRLSRNVAFIANLRESGVDFIAANMPDANRLTINIMAAFAEHEREEISQRTKAAMAAAKKRGVKFGNPRWPESILAARAARGYSPPPLQVMALMLDWRSAGMTLRQIAAQLNGLNIRTPRGFRWYASTVRAALLRNESAHASHDGSAHERNDAFNLACGSEITPERNDAGTDTSFLNGAEFPATPFACPQPVVRGEAKGGTPMPSDIKEAERMIDLFASVGARSFVVTKLDVEQKHLWGKPYSVAELRQKLPAMVRTAADRKPYYTTGGQIVSAGENLIVRPSGPETVFVQLDDLTAEQLDRVRPASFLIIATSPGNHQAWIAASGVEKADSKEIVRRVRKAVGDADMSASGAVRLAGTSNFKLKYGPDYPTVTIIHGIPGRVMTAGQLQRMGLLAEPEPVRAMPLRVSHFTGGRTWPDYPRCVAGAPPNHAKDGPDISRADFTWALMALRRGHSIEDTAAKLAELSSKARENGDRYALVTAQNAAAVVEREKQRSRA
jgi:Resolvase, N terminal domain/RepB DNA-primase from phage plasmid/Recombinase